MNLLNVALNKPNTIKNNIEQSQYNIFAPIATTSLIKPDRPQKSYIVDEPFYMAPVNFATDIKENLINIKNGIKGQSNDHDLGRINDFSMKAGALGLAGYLFTRGKTPMSKSMEFIGFGTFFASMALWPKLFIQAPLKAMYGLDIHQRYVDNEGRKKMFFQDPQYIPWDLYSDDDLAKLGDRLGVPRDIYNRNEVTKKKAHKVALQGNTLWMLTAGFATPLMSALMCNAIEKIATPRSDKSKFPNNIFGAIGSSLEKMRLDKAESRVRNADRIAEKALDRYVPKQLDAIFILNKGQELSDEVIDDITTVIAHNTDDVKFNNAVREQIKSILNIPARPQQLTDEIFEHIRTALIQSNDQADVPDEVAKLMQVDADVISKERLALITKDNPDWSLLIRRIKSILPEDEGTREVVLNAVESFESTSSSKFVLSNEAIEQLRCLDRSLFDYSVRRGLLNNFVNVYFNSSAETVVANRWTNVVSTLREALNLTSKEVEVAKMGEDSALRILEKKLSEVASDDKKYERVFRKVYNAILDFDRTVLPDTADGSSQGIKKVMEDYSVKFYDRMAENFRKLGFESIATRLVGDEVLGSQGSVRDNALSFLTSRTRGIRCDLYKVLHVLDFFRRTADIEKGVQGSRFAQEFFNFNPKSGGLVPRDGQAELANAVADYRRILLSSTIADHTTKFGYYTTQQSLYERLMNLIYSTNFDEKTCKILGITDNTPIKLGEISFVDSFKKVINAVRTHLGNAENPHAPNLKTGDIGDAGDILVRDAHAAFRLDRGFRAAASQAYNSAKWFKMFGGATAVLIGVTLLSETFFGKLKPHDVQGRKENN